MLAVAGNIPIGVTLDSGLSFVAMKVYDVTAGYPGSLVGSAVPMVEYQPGSYGAIFSGTSGKLYAIKKAVYTSGAYATIDNNYPSGDDQVQVMSAGSSAPTVQQIVDGVLNELLSAHTIPGSVAQGIAIGSQVGALISSDLQGVLCDDELLATIDDGALEAIVEDCD